MTKTRKLLVFALFALMLGAGLAIAQTNASGNSSNSSTNSTVTAAANSTATAAVSSNSSNTTATTAANSSIKSGIDVVTDNYIRTGEIKLISNFTSGGSIYYVLNVNGNDQMVFDSAYNPITDDSKLRKILPDYLVSLPLPFKKSDLNLLQTEFSSVNASWSTCQQAYYKFETGLSVCVEQTTRKVPCSFVFLGDLGDAYEIPSANGTARQEVENGTLLINDSIVQFSGNFSALSSNFDSLKFSQLQVQLLLLQNATNELQAGYSLFDLGHEQLIQYPPFATDGGINKCQFDTTSLAGLESSVNVVNQFPTLDNEVAAIDAGNSARLQSGQVNQLASAADAQLSAFASAYNSFKAQFSSVDGLDPAGLTKFYNDLSSLDASLKAAANATTAQSVSAQFTAEATQANTLLTSSQAVVGAYADALKQLNNASASINAALTVYGTSDPRITDLQKQYSDLKASFNLKEADLKAGRPVTATDFKLISSSATNMTATATTLPRRENQVDWVTIAGVVLLVVIIGGGLFLLKKFKGQQPSK